MNHGEHVAFCVWNVLICFSIRSEDIDKLKKRLLNKKSFEHYLLISFHYLLYIHVATVKLTSNEV